MSNIRLDLDEINNFFANYKKTDMPQTVKRLILAGTTLKFGKLETMAIKFRHLRDIAPKVTKNIEYDYHGDIPVIRNVKTSEYSAYAPASGVYLGQFNAAGS